MGRTTCTPDCVCKCNQTLCGCHKGKPIPTAARPDPAKGAK